MAITNILIESLRKKNIDNVPVYNENLFPIKRSCVYLVS